MTNPFDELLAGKDGKPFDLDAFLRMLGQTPRVDGTHRLTIRVAHLDTTLWASRFRQHVHGQYKRPTWDWVWQRLANLGGVRGRFDPYMLTMKDTDVAVLATGVG